MAKEFAQVEVQGRPLRCIICGHDTFWQRDVELSTPLFSFLTLDEAGRAHCAVCERCGYVHMFIPPAAKAEASEPAAGATPQAAA